MKITLTELEEYLISLEIPIKTYGFGEISQFSSLNNIKDNSLIWIKKITEDTILKVQNIKNCIIICSEFKEEFLETGNACIICDNVKMVYFELLDHYFKKRVATNVIGKSSTVLTNKIGENVFIGEGCYIGEEVSIGANTIIKNNVCIENKVEIGENVVINSGTVIGSDGFGYYELPNHTYKKVPDFGGVIIGNHVEIGANTCIDRGTLDNTVIEDGVKIDNLVHIGHNVWIKKNSMIIAQSLLGGSSILGKHSYIAPGVLIRNQIKIGDNSLVGMGAVVTKDIEANIVVAGVPAKKIRDN